MSLLDRLRDETQTAQAEVDADVDRWVVVGTADAYRALLQRMHGFVAPLEQSLLDTPGLDRYLDPRRLRKRELLEHDLSVLGVKDLRSLPQCLSIPLFDNIHDALGWAYVVENGTLSHPNVFRRLAGSIPGEIAFASSFLKCYFGAIGEMWRSFTGDLDGRQDPVRGG